MKMEIDAAGAFMAEVKKIAVRVTNWVGDVVMNLPGLQVLRNNYPDAEIVAIARPWVKQLFHFRPDLIDRTIIFEDKTIMKQPQQLGAFIKSLRRERFDLGVAFTRHFKGAFVLWAAGIPTRIGFSTLPNRWLLNKPLSRESLPKNRHQSKNYVDLLRIAGGMETPDELAPRLHEDEALSRRLRETYLAGHEDRPLMVVHPGAAYGTAKMWFPERFGDICQRFLNRHGGTVAVLGVPAEKPAADGMATRIDHPNYLDLIGECDLKESIGFTSMADMVLTNDSGMMHVAGAFGVPQVAVFGPTDAEATFPYNAKNNANVLHHPVSCSPCKHRVCPLPLHECMDRVSVDEVEQAVEKLLAKN